MGLTRWWSKPRFARAPEVVVPAVAGERHQHRALRARRRAAARRPRSRPCPAARCRAAPGPEARRRAAASAAGPSCARVTSWPSSRRRCPSIVAASTLSSTTSTRSERARLGVRRRRLRLGGARRRRQRQPHHELAAAPRPVAERLHRAAVHLDQRLHQGEADPQPALRAIEGRASPARTGRRPAPAAPASCRCRRRVRVTTASPFSAATIAMCPPASVYLAALLSRLSNTWTRRVGSASSSSGCGASVIDSSCRFSSDHRAAHLHRLPEERVQIERRVWS